MSTDSKEKVPSIQADYSSPSGRESFRHLLPVLKPQPAKEEKIAHLAAMRSTLPILQEQINSLLTQKMEEDKAKPADVKINGKRGTADESKEEENYGEEVIEDES